MRRRRDDVLAAVELGLGNGRVEAVNNKIKVTVRTGYGFRNVGQPGVVADAAVLRRQAGDPGQGVVSALPTNTTEGSSLLEFLENIIGLWRSLIRVII